MLVVVAEILAADTTKVLVAENITDPLLLLAANGVVVVVVADDDVGADR